MVTRMTQMPSSLGTGSAMAAAKIIATGPAAAIASHGERPRVLARMP